MGGVFGVWVGVVVGEVPPDLSKAKREEFKVLLVCFSGFRGFH